MQVGCLGPIVFHVTDETIKTISNGAKWGGSVQVTHHKRHLTDALTEVTGRDADTMDLQIVLSAFRGVNPLKVLDQIWEAERNFVTLPLVLGEKSYGKWRWVIKSHTCSMEHFDAAGNLLACTVSIKLVEYQRKGV